MGKHCIIALLLFSIVTVGKPAHSSERYVTEDKLTRKDVYPYIEHVLAKAGGSLLTIYRVVNQKGKAIVFFRYHNRYGPTGNEQLILLKEEPTGRWYDEKRRYYLLKDGALEELKPSED